MSCCVAGRLRCQSQSHLARGERDDFVDDSGEWDGDRFVHESQNDGYRTGELPDSGPCIGGRTVVHDDEFSRAIEDLLGEGDKGSAESCRTVSLAQNNRDIRDRRVLSVEFHGEGTRISEVVRFYRVRRTL